MEDDEVVRNVLVEMLAALGHESETAASVEEGLRLLGENESAFDVVLLDLIMPDEDGFRFVEECRGKGLLIPVVIATGYAVPEVFARAREYRPIAFLRKPFDVKKLGEVLSTLGKGNRK